MAKTSLVGLVILGLLSAFDVLSPAVFPPNGPGEVGPPLWIVVLTVALGLVSLALIALLVRGGGRGVAGGLVASRVLSALTDVPPFFIDGVPGWIRVVVAVLIVLTVIGCVLVAPALRGRPASSR
ncbi:MAG: hypothetical protein H0V92_02505 [Pseudonocardiales bacterium]|nr:hypothetical protein [Pseudonocardiales bacterium]